MRIAYLSIGTATIVSAALIFSIVQLTAKKEPRHHASPEVAADILAAAPPRVMPLAAQHTPAPTKPAATVASAAKPVSSASAVSIREAPMRQLFDEDRAPVRESWALRNAMDAALKKHLPPTATLDSLECRFRVCRIVLSLDSIETDKQVMNDVFVKATDADFPQGFGTLAIPPRVELPNGGVRTTIYLAREGELLPPSDSATL